MKVYESKTDKALDDLVCNWIQRFEDVHFRCISRFHDDSENGDQFLTVYDPKADCCLTVWLSYNCYGGEILEQAKEIINSKVNPKKGGTQ